MQQTTKQWYVLIGWMTDTYVFVLRNQLILIFVLPAMSPTTKIAATSLVKDFLGPADWNRRLVHREVTSETHNKLDKFMCGTGPLIEEPLAEGKEMDGIYNSY